jgi:hypothetical protein
MLLIVFITQNEARPGHDIDYKTGYFLRDYWGIDTMGRKYYLA